MHKSKPPVTGKYIDPLVDFAFKKIFGSEPNKDLLTAFLNEVFRGRKHIVDLVYNKNEHPGDLKDEGAAIFDLLCTGADGEQFLIEVQRGRQGYFKERALFYTSRLISNQAPKGRRSDWAYNLTEVYLVALLEDFTLEIDTELGYLHDICLCNRETGKIFYDKLGYTYIELSRFVKTETQLETDLDKWLYVLKNMSQMDKIPVYLRKPIFEKLFNIAEYTNLSKEEKTMYDSSLKYKWDNKNVLDYALNEGREAGRQEGIKEGRQEGIKEGMERGKYEEAIAIASEMKKEGFPAVQIAKFTKLSIEEIEKL
ncbi:Rpn family recombination-promoting nuclease/putative transposase [Mucilaginibacter ginsenosidivorax]|uniref:Rpn family recombination-promoting nuclease/putative transposase n=1 Tax=Mucilaginibacter ginsenosidivorax TaxID=862126 RepID=A0A5B8WAE7_9SPHI|nr:Rpn family recombination-promoting nuclease/putative transposase [Mucilaginibacter ginsenosidivorax]QEC80439.1 Rpn family recombination-promoting nuclease/putative transposase [Mucilaginibacter ginsenosidivorax]